MTFEHDCRRHIARRGFLADIGMGFTGLALGAMLHRDGVARAATLDWRPPDGKPHFAPKPPCLNELSALKHTEMTRDRLPSNRQAGGQLGD